MVAARYIKPLTTLNYKVLRKRKSYFKYIKIKSPSALHEMKKKSGDIFQSIEVDPITGEYFIKIPEQIMNDLSWYEDTEISFLVDGNEIVLSEKSSD